LHLDDEPKMRSVLQALLHLDIALKARKILQAPLSSIGAPSELLNMIMQANIIDLAISRPFGI
jgi:hypothetical protein